MRVEVWDGTGENYLGHGTFVGVVDVYAVYTPEGHLLSDSQAEGEPSKDIRDAAEKFGTEVEVIKLNPKIELDSGRVVYGCQVWWQPIPEEGEDNADRRTKNN